MTLFRVLLDLLSSPEGPASAAIRTASDLADTRLTQTHGELEWNAIVAQEIQKVVDVCLEVLDYAESKLIQSQEQIQHASSSDKRPAEDPIAKSSAFMAEGSRTKSAVALRMEVELLQKLLTAGIRANLTDLRDQTRCENLLHRLVTAEQYDLSVQTARQCSMDERPHWEAWVIASIQEGNFISARERVPCVFRLPSDMHMDSSRIRMEARQAAVRLVRVLEMTCPVDLPAFFTLHHSLKHARFSNILMAPAKELMKLVRGSSASDFESQMSYEALGFHEKMKRKDMITVAASSTLREERIRFCEELLAAYAPALLIPFMFRHARGDVACQVMFPAGMEDGPRGVHRKRSGSGGSDRVFSKEIRSGSPVSPVHSEMASESDVPTSRTVSLRQSSTRSSHSRSQSLVTAEASSSSHRHVSLFMKALRTFCF